MQQIIIAAKEVKLLGYANTRFIGFYGCINRIVQHFDDLKTFFNNEIDTPDSLKHFFDKPLAKLLLIFVRDQCEYFESLIKSLEGEHVSGYEAAQKIFSLCSSIRQLMEVKFTSLEFQEELDNISEELPFNDTVLEKVGKRNVSKEICVDTQYIDDMVQRFQGKIFQVHLSIPLLYSSTSVYQYFISI